MFSTFACGFTGGKNEIRWACGEGGRVPAKVFEVNGKLDVEADAPVGRWASEERAAEDEDEEESVDNVRTLLCLNPAIDAAEPEDSRMMLEYIGIVTPES